MGSEYDQISGVKNLVDFQKVNQKNLIIDKPLLEVGHHQIVPLRMPVAVTKRFDKDFEPDEDRTFFGFALGFKDKITNTFVIDSATNIAETAYYPEGFKNQKEYTFDVGFDFSFTIQRFTHTYYSTLDIISALGGIAATIKLFFESVAPLLVLKFMYEFANMMTRKAH
jgi:hypothetical protein